MEDEKIPSRSDQSNSTAGPEKPADTASAAEILEWYFKEQPTPVTEASSEESAESSIDETMPADKKTETEQETSESETTPRRTRAGRNTEKSEKNKLNPAIGIVLAILMLFVGAFSGYQITGSLLPKPIVEGTVGNNVNILVLGCDEREGDTAARSDVIIVATIRPDAKEVSLLSIPRDTRVAIPGHGMDKINHSMAYGGTDMVKATVENFLQIPIHHVVKVNFDGFINVIDALGGVNVEVPCRMYKPLEAIDLLPGYQTLDGADALAFVRWRGDGTGDYGRIERQQQFISALTEKMKKMSVKQALNVANAVMDSIETDMSVRQMMDCGMDMIGMNSGSVTTYSYTGKSVYIGGVNYVEPDMEEVAHIVQCMQYGVNPENSATMQ